MMEQKMVGVRRVLVGAYCVVAAGCGDAVTQPAAKIDPLPNTPLAAYEAVALLDGLGAVLQDTAPALIRVNADTVVAACPLAGRVTNVSNLSFTTMADTSRATIGMLSVPDKCRYSHLGMDFAVTSAPNGLEQHVNIDILFYAEGQGQVVVIVVDGFIGGAVQGSLDWKLDHRFGTCGIDLVIDGGRDLGPDTRLFYVGTLCGHEVRLELEAGWDYTDNEGGWLPADYKGQPVTLPKLPRLRRVPG